jgi:hypothetical protein
MFPLRALQWSWSSPGRRCSAWLQVGRCQIDHSVSSPTENRSHHVQTESQRLLHRDCDPSLRNIVSALLPAAPRPHDQPALLRRSWLKKDWVASLAVSGLCLQMHLFSQMSSSLRLLKAGALSSRLGFEVRNRCQWVHNCQHFDGPAEVELNCVSRSHPSHDLLLDVRFVIRTSTGAFSCRWLNGGACRSNLSILVRSEQTSGQCSRVLAAILSTHGELRGK